MPSVPLQCAELWLEPKVRRLGYAGLGAFAQKHALKPYRQTQIYRAAARELAADVASVSVLPKELRADLAGEGFTFSSVTPVVVQRSSDKQTSKGLFRTHGGAEVEAVLMEHFGDRTTVCISSQAGCAFACAFCATGQAGFGRNLEPDEIFDQALYFARELAERGKRITNIVFMGMGEPFHNYDNVMNAVRLLNDPHGLGLGHRHITISTVGVVPSIRRFIDEGIQVNLAISLHAPNDAVRSRIMPVNRRWATAELMDACAAYVEATNRKVFFEYIMLDGVNDSEASALELASLMRGRLFHVNLIPYNATPDAELQGTPGDRIWAFARILEREAIPVTVRTPMGRDIAAACGQLRSQTQAKANIDLAAASI
jgi:23S rRNA (adenine2503-C2)-methyltransferase